MKGLLKYLKDYKVESVLGPLFKMLEASFELFVPLVVASMIDIGIRNQDTGYILKMAGVLVLLAAIGLACSLTAQFFAAKAAVGFSTALRNALFAHINSLSYHEQDKIGTATLITRMTSDVNQVQSGLNLTLRLLLRSLYCIWRHGDGIYGRYKGGYGLYRGDSCIECGSIWHYGSQYAPV